MGFLNWVHGFFRENELVALEGNIASGKTTNIRRFWVPVGWDGVSETISPGLLELFYLNPPRYAFTFQTETFHSRSFAMERVSKNRSPTIFDRSIFGDFVFATLQRHLGAMTETEYAVYNDLRHQRGWDSLLRQLDRIVYLHTPVETCHTRSQETRRTKAEEGLPLQYFRDVECAYLAALIHTALNRSHVSLSVSNCPSPMEETQQELFFVTPRKDWDRKETDFLIDSETWKKNTSSWDHEAEHGEGDVHGLGDILNTRIRHEFVAEIWEQLVKGHRVGWILD